MDERHWIFEGDLDIDDLEADDLPDDQDDDAEGLDQ